MAHARHHAAGQVKPEIAEVSHAVVDIVSKDVEEEHVAQNVEPVFVEELVGEILPKRRVLGVEGKGVADGLAVVKRQWAVGAISRIAGENKDQDVEGDQSPIGPGDAT